MGTDMQTEVNHLVEELQKGQILIKDFLYITDYGQMLLGEGLIPDDPYDAGVKARGALMRAFPYLEDSGLTAENFVELTELVSKALYEVS